MTVSREQLEQIAGEFRDQDSTQAHASHNSPAGTTSPQLEAVVKALQERGITAKGPERCKDGQKYVLSACLFDAAHQGGTSVAIIEYANGAKQYSCLHEPDCKGRRKWGDVLRKLGLRHARENGRARAAENQAADSGGDKKAKSEANSQRTNGESQAEAEAAILAGATILDKVRGFVSRYMKMSEAQLIAVALWVAHTYAVMISIWTPYLNINSPEKRCGKSRLMEVLRYLVRSPWLTADATPAAMFRKIEKNRPTMFLDEADALFEGDKEKAQAIRAILNAGAHYLGCVSRVVGQGTDLETRDYSVFCPKAVLGIGFLPDTVADRSLQIQLKRKRTSEKVERLREKLVEPVAQPIRAALTQWLGRIMKDLKDATPALPEELNDRQQDGAEPLLAIADAAGDDWPVKARKALIELYAGSAAQNDSIGEKLLTDIREIFGRKDQIFTRDLLTALHAKETSPWGEWGKAGKGLTKYSLASLLKPFKIYPKGTIRIGAETNKGYLRDDFTDAWECYLPPSSDSPKHPPPSPPASATSHPSQCSNDAGKTHFFASSHDPCCDEAKKCVIACVYAGCDGCDVEKSGVRGKATGETWQPTVCR